MSTAVERQAGGKRRITKKPELLAPAGNLEKLKFAIHYGADAVYIGGQKYGLRSNADNFSFEEMREGVEFANRYGARVFVAANIYAHNEDIAGIEDYLRNLQEVGVSAIIVADPAIIETCKRVAPKLEIHLSTQQSTMNWQAVQFWKEEGVHRVVLAREASMEEILEIKRNVDIEIETFIHGAMCSSYSGRCVLSNHFTDRDSNRGGCCQSCRWKYDLFEEGGMDVEELVPEEEAEADATLRRFRKG
jgi:putative protease